MSAPTVTTVLTWRPDHLVEAAEDLGRDVEALREVVDAVRARPAALGATWEGAAATSAGEAMRARADEADAVAAVMRAWKVAGVNAGDALGPLVDELENLVGFATAMPAHVADDGRVSAPELAPLPAGAGEAAVSARLREQADAVRAADRLTAAIQAVLTAAGEVDEALASAVRAAVPPTIDAPPALPGAPADPGPTLGALNFGGSAVWTLVFGEMKMPLRSATELEALVAASKARGESPLQRSNLITQLNSARVLEAAGVDPRDWDPSRGERYNQEIIRKVYEYYADLYLEDPSFQWAGLARMVGPAFAAGFRDLRVLREAMRDVPEEFREEARRLLTVQDRSEKPRPGNLEEAVADALAFPVPLPEALLSMSEEEFLFYESTLLGMQQDIFLDMGGAHEAYKHGGLEAIREMFDAELLREQDYAAWAKLDRGRARGDPTLQQEAGVDMANREQFVVIARDWDKMHDRPVTGQAFTYGMTAAGVPSIPGARPFGEVFPLTGEFETPGPEDIQVFPWPHPVSIDNPLQGSVEWRTSLPDGNVANRFQRWDYFIADTFPAYQAFEADPVAMREYMLADLSEQIDASAFFEDERGVPRPTENIGEALVRNTQYHVDVDQ